jgi:hypothetical protein
MTNVRDFPGSTHRRDLQNITGWLTDLANLTAGNVPLPDAKTKIATTATALIEDYPPAAFTRESLMHVARQCKFFPSYSELCTHLAAWWRDHRPVLPALPAPYEHVPTPERRAATTDELEAVGSIVQRGKREINAAYNAVYARPDNPTAPTRPKPLPLAPEQLALARQAAGIA